MGQLKAVQGELRTLQAAGSGVGAGMAGGFTKAIHHATAFGKNLQWTGRQLEFNFTLPILLAGAAAGKWANDVQAAQTRVIKVYGDLNTTQAQATEAVNHLSKSFEALSNIFGVHQKDVTEIAALWASAGAQGVQLAKATRLTIETMVLGEMDQAEAVKSLLTIQGAYRLNVDQLRNSIEILNVVENETAITLSGLIDVVTRAGGAAAVAGVDIQHLAAMAAALVPATGSAAAAGNALKTLFSRLLAPTKQAQAALHDLGIDIGDPNWVSKNGAQRLEELAQAFSHLTKPQQAFVASQIASRFQINRFDVLMRDILDPLGNYQKALKDTSDVTKNHAVYLRELNTVLSSSPQAWKILTTRLQNALVKVMIPLMPALLNLASRVVALAEAFQNLSPQTQQWIVLGLLLLAAIGPIVRYLGAFITLGSILGNVIKFLFTGFLGLGRALGLFAPAATRAAASLQAIPAGAQAAVTETETVLGEVPIVAGATGEESAVAFSAGWLALIPVIAVAIAAAIVLIKNHWRGILDWLVKTWNRAWDALPHAVQNAFQQVVAVIASAAKSIMEWLSHLNPFARHSPSLVDQIKKGTTVISDQYAGVKQAPDSVNRMAEAHRNLQSATVTPTGQTQTAASSASVQADKLLQAALDNLTRSYQANQSAAGNWSAVLARAKKVTDDFTAATRAAVDQLHAAEMRKDVQDILPFAPNAAKFIDSIIQAEKDLESAMAAVTVEIDKQQSVVDDWQRKLQAANDALDSAQTNLEQLRKTASAAQDDLSNAKEVLSQLADTPIAGMKAMSDAIFSADMGVKRLQLDILNADRAGQGINQQIYQNTLAQKKLQLQMLRMQDQVGMSADDARDKLGKLQGELELLHGQATELRLAGAGSDVLGPINDQIKALNDQQVAMQAMSQPLQNMQDQLDALQHQAQILDLQHELDLMPLNHQLDILQQNADALNLEQSLQFDPLTRELDQLVHSMKEMPFDQLRQQIIDQKTTVDNLTVAYDQANAAVDAQQTVVDNLTASRDAINKSYDDEKNKLDTLKNTYQDLNTQLQDLQSAWQGVASASKSAVDNTDQFAAAGQGDFPDVTGAGANFGDPGSLADIDKLTAEWEKEIKKQFGNLDLFKPLKDQWHAAWQWIANNIGPEGGLSALGGMIIGAFLGGPFGAAIGAGLGAGLGKPIAEGLKQAFDWAGNNVDSGGILSQIADAFSGIGDKLKPVFDWFKKLFSGFNAEPVLHVFGLIGRFIQGFVQMIVDQASKWGDVWRKFMDVVNTYLPVVLFIAKPILAALLEAFRIVVVAIEIIWRIFWPVLVNVLKPVLDAIITIVKGALEIIHGIFMFVLSVLTLDWKGAWDGIKDIFQGIWDLIKGIFSGVVGGIIGIARGLIEGIISVFIWLYNALVGHSIVWDIINGIIAAWNFLIAPVKIAIDAVIEVIRFAWENVIKPILDAFIWFIQNVLAPVFGWLWHTIVEPVFHGISTFVGTEINGIKAIVQGLIDFIKNDLAPVFGWIWHTIIEPAWNGIKTITESIWNGITSTIRTVVNGVISVINVLIDGFNAIVDHIPGLGRFHIDHIHLIGAGGNTQGPGMGGERQHVAAAGMQIGGGFRTQGERVIVGEGRRSYPEYVIPTDPTYRGRAMQLYQMLGSDLGASRQLGIGDTIGHIAVGIGHVVEDAAQKAREIAVKAALAPFMFAADKLINQLPGGMFKESVNGLKNTFYNWAIGKDIPGAASGGILYPSYVASLAGGGVVRARPGVGTVVRLGEGRRDEAVTPLPTGWDGGSKRELHFHGDLVFPNIRTGDDAEKLIENLEALA